MKQQNIFSGLIKSYKKHFTVCVVLLFIITVIDSMLQISQQLLDSDTGFLLASGKYIVENHVIPTINPFIISDNFKIIIQQWGFDVLVYEIYSHFNFVGLYILTIILLTIISVILWKIMSIYTENFNIKIGLLTIFVYCFKYWSEPRPTLISCLLILITILILEYYRRSKHKWLISFLPLISLIEINMHASFWPMLFVFMLPYVAPNIFNLISNVKLEFKKWIKMWWPVLAIIVIMIAVGFLNPYGLKGMLYLFLSYGEIDLAEVPELDPAQIYSEYAIVCLIAIISLVIYFHKNKSRSDSALIYMTIGTLILAIPHMRNTWFLFFGTLPLLCVLLTDMLAITASKRAIQISTIAVVLLVLIGTILVSLFGFFGFKDNYTWPVMAADYLDQFNNKDDITVYTEHNGGYMQYRGYKTYMDGRPELFVKAINEQEDLLAEWYMFAHHPIDSQYVLEKYKFSHLIVKSNSPLAVYLFYHDDYTQILTGDNYLVYERIDWDGDSKLIHD